MEKEIQILTDDGNRIECNLLEKVEVTRQEVAEIEKAIAVLEQEIVERNEKLEELKAKVEFAKKIIATADEIKATETVEVDSAEVVNG